MSAADDQALAELEAWGREPDLSELDTLMWRTERHPSNSWTGVVVMLLDAEADWERFVDAHDWGVRLVPRFAQRVIDPLVSVGTAYWADDPDFDLAYHVRRETLPGDGTTRQLLDFAQTLGATPMDRARPPWLSVLVQNLEGGRSAWVIQVHHVLMDGGGATQLFERVLSTSRKPRTNRPEPPPVTPAPARSPAAVAARQVARQTLASPRLAGKAIGAAAGALRNPIDTAKYASSLARVATPPAASKAAFLAPGPRKAWRFGVMECSLTDLKRASKAVGGTVNDGYLCAVLGGLRRYAAALGHELDDIPISMPVSVRTDEMGGNRFTGAYFEAPAGAADPVDRMRQMRSRVAAVRTEPALDFVNTVMPVLNRTPGALATAAMTALNRNAVLTSSSWPGVTKEVFVAGAKFERFFVFGPLPGTRLTAAMNSHLGTCCIGLNVDGDVFTDLDLLWSSMRDGLDEILALA